MIHQEYRVIPHIFGERRKCTMYELRICTPQFVIVSLRSCPPARSSSPPRGFALERLRSGEPVLSLGRLVLDLTVIRGIKRSARPVRLI
jgi:hypothetical protein